MDKINKAFPDEIHLKDMGLKNGSRLFMLEKNDFRFFSSYGLITVPMNFITDGVSSPKWAWGIVGPFSDAFPSALAHDWCFSPLNEKFTFMESNGIFLEGMKICGVPFVKRMLIYSAVSTFGWFVYRGYKG